MGGDKANNIISTQLDILASPAVATRVVEQLRLENDPQAEALLGGTGPLAWILQWKAAVLDALNSFFADEPAEERSIKQWMAERLLSDMSAKTNRDSRMVRIVYSSPDPKFSAAVANAFLRAYQETVLNLKIQPAKQSTEWFDEQVRKLKLDLEEAEARLAKFQQAKGIVATDERMDLESARLAELSAQLSIAESASYESAAREREIRNFIGGSSGNLPPEVAASPLVQQLRAGLAEREAKMGELASCERDAEAEAAAERSDALGRAERVVRCRRGGATRKFPARGTGAATQPCAQVEGGAQRARGACPGRRERAARL